MTHITANVPSDALRVIRLDHDRLRVEVSPDTGGRITRLIDKGLATNVLWRNPALALTAVAPGSAYDPHFFGGIDDILPGDLPERLDGFDNPDHGEAWTAPMAVEIGSEHVRLSARLPLSGLHLVKTVSLQPGASVLVLDYAIENRSTVRRCFLWKLHAALRGSPGDRLLCPAGLARVADPAWARQPFAGDVPWPAGAGVAADRLPSADGTTDFLFLHALRAGQVSLARPTAGYTVHLTFDPAVFPYVCYFASYGAMDGLYVAVLEPASAMPLSVNEAMRLGQCTCLVPGERLSTQVLLTIEAGASR